MVSWESHQRDWWCRECCWLPTLQRQGAGRSQHTVRRSPGDTRRACKAGRCAHLRCWHLLPTPACDSPLLSSPLPFPRHRLGSSEGGCARLLRWAGVQSVWCLYRSCNISMSSADQCLWRRCSSGPVHVQVCHPRRPTPCCPPPPEKPLHTQHAVQHHLQTIDWGGPRGWYWYYSHGTRQGDPLVREQATPCTAPEKTHHHHHHHHPCDSSHMPARSNPPHACSRVPPASAAAAAATKPVMQQECAAASWPPGAPYQTQCVQQDSLPARERPPANARPQTILQTSTVHHTGPCKASAATHGGGVHQVALCPVLQQQQHQTVQLPVDCAHVRVRACDAAHKAGTHARKSLRPSVSVRCGCKTSQLSQHEQHPSVQAKDQNKHNTSHPTR